MAVQLDFFSIEKTRLLQLVKLKIFIENSIIGDENGKCALFILLSTKRVHSTFDLYFEGHFGNSRTRKFHPLASLCHINLRHVPIHLSV